MGQGGGEFEMFGEAVALVLVHDEGPVAIASRELEDLAQRSRGMSPHLGLHATDQGGGHLEAASLGEQLGGGLGIGQFRCLGHDPSSGDAMNKVRR